jgi:hypothetical protein
VPQQEAADRQADVAHEQHLEVHLRDAGARDDRAAIGPGSAQRLEDARDAAIRLARRAARRHPRGALAREADEDVVRRQRGAVGGDRADEHAGEPAGHGERSAARPREAGDRGSRSGS